MIHLKPRAGLSNRMRAIDSGVALAKALDLPLRIYWCPEKLFRCPFHLLFQPIQGTDVEMIETDVLPIRFYGVFFFISSLLRRLGFHRQTFKQHEFDLLRNLDHSTVRRDEPITIESYSRFYSNPRDFHIFVPTPELLQRIDERASKFSSHTVGVHVRRTDNAKSIKYSPDALFVQHMQAEIDREPETNFYLATDSPETKKYFINVFGDRIITTPYGISRDTVEGNQDAVVELYTLSRTRKILGSYWSSYSETAAAIGNIELVLLKGE